MKNAFSFEEYQRDPQKFIERQIKKAKKWKRGGFPIEVLMEQEDLEFQSMKLGSNSYYYQKIERNKLKQEEDQAQIDDIRSRYEHFVNSEKVTLSDRVLAGIDKLLAQLNNLKSRAKEQKKFMSNSK